MATLWQSLRYTLRVFLPGRAKPIVHRGLSFRAIYLGAALDDLKAQSKNDNGAIAGLHDRLRAVDGDMTEDDIRSVIAEWLDDPELIATPELQEGDRVRVEIAGPAVRRLKLRSDAQQPLRRTSAPGYRRISASGILVEAETTSQ